MLLLPSTESQGKAATVQVILMRFLVFWEKNLETGCKNQLIQEFCSYDQQSKTEQGIGFNFPNLEWQ